jgi:NADPH:quinone reductase-like Zn-dependent oxidoreductase
MKAFILDRYGSADRVRAGDMPDPELREDDVLVQIHAAGVNLLDSRIRNGEFKFVLRYRLPLILGHDVAGVVVRTGSRVRRFKPGDEVYARGAYGIRAASELGADRRKSATLQPSRNRLAALRARRSVPGIRAPSQFRIVRQKHRGFAG